MSILWAAIGVMTLLAVCFVLYPLLRAGVTTTNVVLAVVLLATIVGGSWGLYWMQGSPRAYEAHVLMGRLKQRLAKRPHSARGWYLLGRLYQDTGQPDKARQAWRRALKLGSLYNESMREVK